jgi:hypothetical protein
MMKYVEGSGSESGSGSLSQRHGSADPDPHQNVMDPQYWFNITLCVSVVWRNILRGIKGSVISAQLSS